MRSLKTVLLFLVIISFPYQTLASEDCRKITVTGKSEIVLDAQYAVIGISIKEVKDEMNQSHAVLIKTTSDLTERLKQIGLSDADIKKSLIKQGKEYSYENQ